MTASLSFSLCSASTSANPRALKGTEVNERTMLLVHTIDQNGPTPMTSPQQSAAWQGLRCAIAMNNAGCLLLEKNCHVQASATFQDALQLARVLSAVEGGDDADPSVVAVPLQLFYSKLKQAERRLSSPEHSSLVIPYETLEYHATSPSLHPDVAPTNCGVYCPIRVGAVEADDTDLISTRTLSSILLINYAISYRGVAQAESQASTGPPELGGVLRILTLANMLVEQCEDYSEQALFLLLAALDTTARALREMGKLYEAEQVQDRLIELTVYVEMNLSFLYSPGLIATAA